MVGMMGRKPEILHIEFEPDRTADASGGIRMICWPPFGCGVTGYGYDDALALLQRLLFQDKPVPKISKVINEIDMNVLLGENKHIGVRCCAVWRVSGGPVARLADHSSAVRVIHGIIWQVFHGIKWQCSRNYLAA